MPPFSFIIVFLVPPLGSADLVSSQHHIIFMMAILDYILLSGRASHPSPFLQAPRSSYRLSCWRGPSNHNRPSSLSHWGQVMRTPKVPCFSFPPGLREHPSSWTYRELKRSLDMTKASPGEFSVCFTELQQKFFNNRPRKLKDLILLVKHWYEKVIFKLHICGWHPFLFMEIFTSSKVQQS